MATIVRLDSHVCPRCGLQLRVARGENAMVMRYDMAGWAQQCARADGDGPTDCPWIGPALHALLRHPEAAPQEETPEKTPEKTHG